MSIPSVGGAVWTHSWSAPTDGPFTVLAKLIHANAWRPRDVARFLDFPAVRGSSVESSLFFPEKPHDFDERYASLHELVASHDLGRVMPRLVHHLAGESRLRYCPDCMRVGFQAATCQIDGVVNCLIHDRPLICNCQHCGAETPRYGVTKEVRLCCAHCGWSWCGQRVGEPSQSAWGKPDQFGRFEALHRWLASLNAPEVVDWRNLDIWNIDATSRHTRYDLQGDHYRQRRTAVFEAIDEVVRGSPVFTTLSHVSVLGPYAHDGSYCGRQARDWRGDEQIYQQLGMLATEDERAFYGHFTTFSGDGVVPVPIDPIVPPEVHAKILWRAQIHSGPGLRYAVFPERSGARSLEPSMLSRLLGLRDSRSWELNCDRALKLGVLTACKGAARRAADRWHAILRRKGRCAPNELIEDFQAHRRELGVWQLWDHFPIGFISVGARDLRTGDKGRSEEVYLAIM